MDEMDSDVSEGIDPRELFYKDRPDWSDIQGIPPDEGPDPVVKIMYSPRFRDVYDYFRAIVAKGEKSNRVLSLTADALTLNPANYSVWAYRREVLEALKIPKIVSKEEFMTPEFHNEFKYSEEMIEENAKNYQVWHHRKVLVSWAAGLNLDFEGQGMLLTDEDCKLTLLNKELELTRNILRLDSKNYHAWQHRLWMIHTFNNYDQELTYVNFLIDSDVRNNSAWNQRYFILKNKPGTTDGEIEEEIKYTWDWIKKYPSNESAWNYLEGITKLHNMALDKQIQNFGQALSMKRDGVHHHCVLSFLLHSTEFFLKCRPKLNPREFENSRNLAYKICEQLMMDDPVRAKYWEYKKREYEPKH